MKRSAVIFTAPNQIEIRQESLPAGSSDQVLVAVRYSAISAGTELLIYRGLAPTDMAADSHLPDLSGTLTFPLKYGYACVGDVVDTRNPSHRHWLGQQVFAFHPHESHFWAHPDLLHPLPPGLAARDALFLPNMETALNFLHDGRPLAGEDVVVFGQGVVGLLTTSLLARMPLRNLVTLDRYALRRQASQDLGAHASLDPTEKASFSELQASLGSDGADLIYELSGAPAALDQAIAIGGFSSRVVIGSWYGRKPVALHLGGMYHRHRIQVTSSQVSTLAPVLSGRWTKTRRLQMAWQLIKDHAPANLITHEYPVERASAAFQLIAEQPQTTIQVLLTY